MAGGEWGERDMPMRRGEVGLEVGGVEAGEEEPDEVGESRSAELPVELSRPNTRSVFGPRLYR